MIHHPVIRPDWVRLTKEPAIEPERPICDPHHHLWERPGSRYRAEDLIADLDSGHNIVSTVFIECGAKYRSEGPEALRPVGETEFVVAEATRAAADLGWPTRIAAGIVGFVDLRLGAAVDDALAAHAAAAQGRFRGVRQCASADPDPRVPQHRTRPPAGLLGDPSFREGFARLAPFGAHFEAWIYHPQLPELIDLAEAFPETSIVLNHVGGPLGIGPYAEDLASARAAWHDALSALAKCENVHVKLGGLGMALCGFGWQDLPKPPASQEFAETAAPFVHHAVDCFGIERAFFESNFPVDKESCGYGILWNALKRIGARYSAREQDALFHDNAARLYRLADPAEAS